MLMTAFQSAFSLPEFGRFVYHVYSIITSTIYNSDGLAESKDLTETGLYCARTTININKFKTFF